MRRIVALSMAAVLTSGCAVSRMPSFSFSGSGETSETEAAALFGQQQAKEESSALGNLWDNFSAPFRSSKPAPQPAASPAALASVKPDFKPEEALRLVNAYRTQKGLRALTLEPRLSKAAFALATDMSRYDRMSHYGPDGADIEHRLASAGYDFSVAAENIGAGQQSVEEMVEGWKKSAPHSKNMLISDARHMGIAMQHRPDSRFKTFWTLVIGAPAR